MLFFYELAWFNGRWLFREAPIIMATGLDLVILEMVGKSRDLVITADLILMSSIFPNSHSHSAILCWA